jgi:glucans biosynthesis protein C
MWDALRIPQFHHGLIALYTTSWHLWFLGFLLVFSLLALPLFVRAGAEPRGCTLIYLAGLCEEPWGLAVLGLPIMLIKLSLNAAFPSYLDWSDTLVFFVLFIYGWLFMTDIRFMRAIASQTAAWFFVGCICFATIVGTYELGYLMQWLTRPDYSWGYLLYQILVSVDTWAWLLAIIGFGLRSLNFGTASLEYATEATLPFYILHQPVILTIAFLVVQYQIGMVWKASIIAVTAFGATVLAYELVVRRSMVVRTLFGMKSG